MASITIRNLDESLKTRLRLRSAGHGRSMEGEVRDILAAALDQWHAVRGNLAASIRGRFARLGGVDLLLVSREPIRALGDFIE